MVADLDPKFQKPQIVSTKYDKSRTGNWWNPLKETKRGYNLKTLNGGIVSKKFGQLLKEKNDKYLDNICFPTIDLDQYGYDTLVYQQKYCKKIET